METIENSAVAAKPRQTILPLLVVLFLISFFLLTWLVVLQDRTIDSQRSLIHSLFNDNLHLVATRLGLHGNPAAGSNSRTAQGRASVQTRSTRIPQAQISSSQVPSTQTPLAQAPSTQVPVTEGSLNQAKPQASTKSGRNSRKAQKAPPMRPPVEVTDPSDMRRVSISI